ncbi:MAG: glutamine transport system ATP-binding protein [Verrucomicrobiota bacterium]|jgi:ABC-type polar amino acid transport system ATPase subunit
MPLSSSSGSEILRVHDIWKRFCENEVLKGISFALREREILGVIGPSGSGKSTLLRCLDLLEVIDKGQIEYHGSHDLTFTPDGLNRSDSESYAKLQARTRDAVTALRKDVGFVFQGFNLWEEKSVLANMVLAPMVVLQETLELAEQRARELCGQFGLEKKLNAKVWQLSGGQKQRVAIIRALMMRPKIILLDEITSALDPVLTVDVMQAIRQLQAEGLAMIIVTHHIEFASSLCDRIMFISHGEAIQVDTPENLRASPVTKEVKKFLELLRAAR